MRSVGPMAFRLMAWASPIPGTSAPWLSPRELPLEIRLLVHTRGTDGSQQMPQSSPTAPTGYRYSSILRRSADRQRRNAAAETVWRICGSRGSGLRAQGSGLRAQGLEYRVQGSGLRVQGLEYRVQGSGFSATGAFFVEASDRHPACSLRHVSLDEFSLRISWPRQSHVP